MINEEILVQTEDQNLLRDVHSKGLINKNLAALNEYKMRKNVFKKMNHENSETKIRLNKLEEDMAEIKSLLLQIADMRGKNARN